MGFIQIDKKALINNINVYEKLLGNKNKICMALKNNAYGHGIEQISHIVSQYGIKHSMVRDTDEALRCSKYNFESILILYDMPKTVYNHNFIFAVNSFEDLSLMPSGTKIELKIDTGMSRNGININQIDDVLSKIEEYDLKLYGVFTHFCCANNVSRVTIDQEMLFLEAVDRIKKQHKYSFRIHCSNSDGANKIDNSLYDIARIGIGLYGYNDDLNNQLLPVLSLWANKISTRVLKKGDKVGYGGGYTNEKDNFLVSNYNIGYGDGFFRIDEKQHYYTKDGYKILGRTSMDSLSLNTDVKCVCIFDDVTYLAKLHNTIIYEILTNLSSFMKRVIKD